MSDTLTRAIAHRVVPAAQLDVRLAAEAGRFEGYANLWDVVDSYGTRFRKGAFTAGGLDDRPYALLWMHNATEVIGTFTAREDDTGLLVAGAFADTQRGRESRELARLGAAPELSVGFSDAITADDDEQSFVAVRLVEVSLITARMASTPGAALTAVRAAEPECARCAALDAAAVAQRQVEQAERVTRARLAAARLRLLDP